MYKHKSNSSCQVHSYHNELMKKTYTIAVILHHIHIPDKNFSNKTVNQKSTYLYNCFTVLRYHKDLWQTFLSLKDYKSAEWSENKYMLLVTSHALCQEVKAKL